eukprot:3959583-Alexandrium_andersonii.AAC.1
MRGSSADLMAAISPAAVTLTESARSANWLTTQGLSTAIHCTQGSFPGDLWADGFFGLIHAK